MRPSRDDSAGRREEATTAAPETRTARAWHEALNGDGVHLVGLSHPEVEVGGPRGTAHGTQLLREWVSRANIRLEPRCVFHRADTVVVEQRAEWRAATGKVTVSQAVGSVFVVREGRVARVIRYPDLADALGAANLDRSHEIQSD